MEIAHLDEIPPELYGWTVPFCSWYDVLSEDKKKNGQLQINVTYIRGNNVYG